MGRIITNSRPIDTRLQEVIEAGSTSGPKFAAIFGDFAGLGYVRNQATRPVSHDIGIVKGANLTRSGIACAENGNVIVPSVFGSTNSNDTIITVGVTVPPGGSSGAWVKIGGTADGVGVGIGNTTLDNVGSNIIVLREGIAWVATGVALTTGFHIITFLFSAAYSALKILVDGNTSESYNAATGFPFNNPTTATYFGGYDAAGGILRFPESSSLHFAAIFTNTASASPVEFPIHAKAWSHWQGTKWSDPANLSQRARIFLPSSGGTTSYLLPRASRAQQHLLIR